MFDMNACLSANMIVCLYDTIHQDPEQHTTTNLPGQHHVTTVADNKVHKIENRSTPTPPYPVPHISNGVQRNVSESSW